MTSRIEHAGDKPRGMQPLSVRECAAQCGVSEDFIRARILSGELRAMRRIRRGYRVRPEWLDSFLAQRVSPVTRDEPPPPPHRSARRAKRPTASPASFASSAEARRALRGPRGGES